MDNKFVLIKNKNNRARWLKSILLGLAFGGIFGGVFLALFKLKILTLAPIWALPIGVGGGLLAWLVTWLLLWRTDRALAKKLDKKFALHERVQTMLEYKHEEGAMYELQRADTEATLQAIPKKKLRIKRLWIYALAFVLGVATFAGSIVIKPKADDPGGGPPPTGFELTAEQRRDLITLVNTVKTSKMQSPYKERTVAAIENMTATLETVDLEQVMEKTVDATISELLTIMDESSWVVEFTEALWGNANDTISLPEGGTEEQANVQIKALAKALNSYEWEEGWQEAEEQTALRSALSNFTYAFKHASVLTSEPGTVLDWATIVADTAQTVKRASENLAKGLQAYEELRGEKDAFFLAVERLNDYEAYGLKALSEELLALGKNGTLQDYNDLFENEIKFTKLIEGVWWNIYNSLTPQQENISVGENAVKEICRIFSISRPRFKRPSLVDVETGGGEEDGDVTPTPLPPETETKYGSKEWILDYLKNEQVLYGEIFGGYESDALDKARDEKNSYTEEERKAIEKYFEILKEGFKEKGDANE